jgi:hypothetical protein
MRRMIMNELSGEPKCQDLVKNKTSNVTGVVIAKYPEWQKDRNLLDIRLETDTRGVWYGSPAEFWEVIKAYDVERR